MSAFLLSWVVTASLLTAAVILLRAAFGRRISARLRYALWALVLVRLLVPGQLFTAPVEAPRVFLDTQTVQVLPAPRRTPAARPRPTGGGETPVQTASPSAEEPAPAPAAQSPVEPLALLGWTWGAGTLAVSAAFLISNLLFARKLRRVRVPLAADCPLRVYTAAGLPSPCLFGVLRPAVYVSPETAADPTCIRHVLVHETTHFRHGDHVWSLLRCAALAIHWWNPLAWLAALLSRRDAELACDEGALKRLGDGERQAYGATLLALVTAKPQPGDLLCCATTMTGDKRSLRERIGRIAHAPRRWLWAAVVSVALAALVCACSFAKTQTPDTEDRPLTADELDVFNNRAFNHQESGVNMLNQLLLLAAETPEDYKRIDLYQLFYNGAGQPVEITEEERRAAALAHTGSEESEWDLIKCPAGEMDEVLQEFLGLPLEETDKVGLDRFIYLPEYDAYYDFHTDTNYPGDVTFLSGERKDGKVLLYYESESFPVLSSGDGSLIYPEGARLNCVTLEEQAEGWFRFLSNWPCGLPAVPTVYPDREPELVIPLDGLEPYEPEAVTVERHTGDVAESLYTACLRPDGSGGSFDVEIYRSTDGNLCAAVVVSETERDCFLTVPARNSARWTPEGGARTYTGLFGRDGLSVSYYGQLDENSYGEIHDYYTFPDSGTPSLLLRAKGSADAADMDGDGAEELVASDGWNTWQLFFQRDGKLWEADIAALIHESWPEAGYLSGGSLNSDSRFLSLSVEVPLPGSDITVSAFRTLWFDGENLRLYKDASVYAGHVNIDIDAPGEVLAAARQFVQGEYEALAAEGYGADGSGDYSEGNFGPGNAVWDDWVLKDLQGPYFEQAGPHRVEVWNLDYETHTTTPDRVILAGGSYLGEDGWCRIGYPGSDYLYFRRDDSGERTFLFSRMENDCSPGSPLFWADMVYQMEDLGLLRFSHLAAGEQLALLDSSPVIFFDRLGDKPQAERDQTLALLALAVLENPNAPEYTRCAEDLSESGVYAGSLSAGGRAAWEQLQGLVQNTRNYVRDVYVEASRKAGADELRDLQIPGMSLPELFRFLDQSDGAYTMAAMGDLMQRFQEDPAAVLSALAEWENGGAIADSLGVSLYWNEDFVPGALEQAQSLTLDGREAALLERITAAHEAKRLEESAPGDA